MSYSLTDDDQKLKIDSLEKLPLLKQIMEDNNLKPNFSALAEDLRVDRRTVKKYYDGYIKEIKRNKPSKIDEFRPILDDLLLKKSSKRFYSKMELRRYMRDNHGLKTSSSNFMKYISNDLKYQEYFD